ncbi:MAG: hypothetical protein R3E18_03780 [Sphingomonadaceae bacterium]|nr:hypothetical protein [Sphingomonadaceae bacterium]
MRKLALRALAGLLLLVGVATAAAALHARNAIANGALEKPVICLNARHYDVWKAGTIPPKRMDGLLAQQVRSYYLNDEAVGMGNWHLRGAWAQAGLWLGYSKSQRQSMAMSVIKRMDICLQDRERYRGKTAPPASK